MHLYHGSDREKDAEKLSEFDVVITTYDIGMISEDKYKILLRNVIHSIRNW